MFVLFMFNKEVNMANNCNYTMAVWGQKKNIEEFVRMLKWKDEFAKCGLGRVFSAIVFDEQEIGNDLFCYQIEGDCAWSVECALTAYGGRKICLESETKRLDLLLEVFSEEVGECFQEHYRIRRGEILLNECRRAERWFLDELSDKDLQKLCEEYQLTKEAALGRASFEDGYCTFGGFGAKFNVFWDHADWNKK